MQKHNWKETKYYVISMIELQCTEEEEEEEKEEETTAKNQTLPICNNGEPRSPQTGLNW